MQAGWYTLNYTRHTIISSCSTSHLGKAEGIIELQFVNTFFWISEEYMEMHFVCLATESQPEITVHKTNTGLNSQLSLSREFLSHGTIYPLLLKNRFINQCVLWLSANQAVFSLSGHRKMLLLLRDSWIYGEMLQTDRKREAGKERPHED